MFEGVFGKFGIPKSSDDQMEEDCINIHLKERLKRIYRIPTDELFRHNIAGYKTLLCWKKKLWFQADENGCWIYTKEPTPNFYNHSIIEFSSKKFLSWVCRHTARLKDNELREYRDNIISDIDTALKEI